MLLSHLLHISDPLLFAISIIDRQNCCEHCTGSRHNVQEFQVTVRLQKSLTNLNCHQKNCANGFQTFINGSQNRERGEKPDAS